MAGGKLNKEINLKFLTDLFKKKDKNAAAGSAAVQPGQAPGTVTPDGVVISRPHTHLEINLVPDIKDEMIKALKFRNLVFYICIVVSIVSLGTSIIFVSIAAGQQAAADGKKGTLDNLTAKLTKYSDLGDFLTIRDQLDNLSKITDNKKLLSRIFNTIAVLFPSGSNGTIKMSELNINLASESPTISFDAQADAPGGDDGIDYNVLDSFKKSMQYMRYDYGSYVDKDSNEIPAYCMIENGTDGATLSDPDKGYYAYWLIDGEGCKADGVKASDYTIEQYNGQNVVRIWRTPQFQEWYQYSSSSTGSSNQSTNASNNSYTSPSKPSISLDGEIENVAHFASQCITYSGTPTSEYVGDADSAVVAKIQYRANDSSSSITWARTNSSCLLVPDGTEGINITDSSNGRGSSDELVLRFSAIITLNSEIFKFNSHHVLAMAPTGRFNVTDSYVQLQSMFTERAADCAPGDTACSSSLTGGDF